MKITTAVLTAAAAAALTAGLAACAPSATTRATPAAQRSATRTAGLAAHKATAKATTKATAKASAEATAKASAEATAKATAEATLKPATHVSASASAADTMPAAQTAAMNKWYSGATVAEAANVCGDVYRVYSDNVAISSGSGSSSLEADITSLQHDVTKALSNPPPVAADATIWETVLNAYSDDAGDPTNSGLVAAARSSEDAAWNWAPSFGGTLLVCVNVNA
jgi:hypothetical protein